MITSTVFSIAKIFNFTIKLPDKKFICSISINSIFKNLGINLSLKIEEFFYYLQKY